MSRTKFIVLSAPRSGTTWLVRLLQQHSKICCFEEIMHRRVSARLPVAGEKYRDEDDGAGFVDRMYTREYGSETCVGFKLMYEHAQKGRARSVWEYLSADSGIKVVHMVRDNKLEAYVSLKKAKARGRWLVKAGTPRPPDPGPVTIDPADFERYVADIAAKRKRALSFVVSHEIHTLTYEDMVRRRKRSLRGLTKFLEVRAYPWLWRVQDRTAKEETLPMSQRISNFDELAEKFSGTPFASYIESSHHRAT